ncbi:hypothetical protein BC829DRAFT_211116 [Chytridium lagenaria]|nr:hypothetical protein BC829DRAFT_211116 [Chytridium lagenaria]
MLFEDEEVSWGCILDVDDESQTFARRETILMPPGKRMRLMEDDSEDDVIIGLQEGADKQPETCPSDNAYLGIQPQFMDVDEHGTEGMMVDEVDMTFGGEEAPTESLQKDDVLKRLETASIKIQSLMRMIRCRREFRETLSRIILVQSLWRRNLARRRFVKDRRSIIKIQRWWKRRKQQKESSPSVRRSRRNTTKVVNYSLEEKKKTLEKNPTKAS